MDVTRTSGSLVDRLEGKPFVLLGINGRRPGGRQVGDGQGADDLALVVNGGKTGSTVLKWGVLSWPTVYILDCKGVIRYHNVRFEAMDQAIDRLVKEAEAGDQ